MFFNKIGCKGTYFFSNKQRLIIPKKVNFCSKNEQCLVKWYFLPKFVVEKYNTYPYRVDKMDNKQSKNDLYFCSCLTEEKLQRAMGRSILLNGRVAVAFTAGGSVNFELNGVTYEVTDTKFLIVSPNSSLRFHSFTPGVCLYFIGFLPALQDVVSKQFSISFFYYVHQHPLWSLTERSRRALLSFYDIYDYTCNVQPGQFSTEIANSMFCIFIQVCYQSRQVSVELSSISDTSMTTRSLGARFFKLVHENYKAHHNVSYYADILCVSSKYLAQVVRTFSTRTPKDIIDRRLAVEALFLLTKTEMNIQEISNELGFPDQSYFGRFFKRVFGLSPLNYRMNPDFSLIERLTDKIILSDEEENSVG